MSAKLDISSTTSGILIPRMTQAERNAIGTPATGYAIFQTNNTAGFYYYNGASWSAVTSPSVTADNGLTLLIMCA